MFSWILIFLAVPSFAKTTYLLENYFSYSKNFRSETLINQDNQILKLPSQLVGADIRGELKWKGKRNQLVFRPRYQAEKKVIIAGGETTSQNESDWNITDAFWETYLSANLSVTSGLQVYQWGPAELMNPSNPLFHFSSGQKSFGYKEKGKVLIRTNYTIGRAHSFVLIAEPVSNNESPWVEGEFIPKALVKYEYQSQESPSQFGLTSGQEERENSFAGAYFTWQATEAFSIYSDTKTYEREIGFKPESSGLFWDLVEPLKQKSWPVLSVNGLRWEGDFDVRIEHLYNSAGYSEEEWSEVLNAVSNPFNPNFASNLRKFQKPGLELPGKQYLYLSYRVNEPFEMKELNIYLRDLHSLQDYSSQMQLEFDKAMTDSIVVFGNVTGTSGRKEAEFKLLNSWQTTLGFKWVL